MNKLTFDGMIEKLKSAKGYEVSIIGDAETYGKGLFDGLIIEDTKDGDWREPPNDSDRQVVLEFHSIGAAQNVHLYKFSISVEESRHPEITISEVKIAVNGTRSPKNDFEMISINLGNTIVEIILYTDQEIFGMWL